MTRMSHNRMTAEDLTFWQNCTHAFSLPSASSYERPALYAVLPAQTRRPLHDVNEYVHFDFIDGLDLLGYT